MGRLVVGVGLLAVVGALSGCNGFFVSGHTSTILTSSAASAAYGTSITLTAKISTTAATGEVEFFDGTTELGEEAVSSGTATYTTSSLATGTHVLTAEYLGDSTYNESTSGDVDVVISSSLTSTTTTLSASALSIVYGSTLTLTATVSSTAATGTINFYDEVGTAITEIGSVTLSSGTASLAINTLAAETHTLYATYVGDSTYAESTSGTISVGVTAASSSAITAAEK